MATSTPSRIATLPVEKLPLGYELIHDRERGTSALTYNGVLLPVTFARHDYPLVREADQAAIAFAIAAESREPRISRLDPPAWGKAVAETEKWMLTQMHELAEMVVAPSRAVFEDRVSSFMLQAALHDQLKQYMAAFQKLYSAYPGLGRDGIDEALTMSISGMDDSWPGDWTHITDRIQKELDARIREEHLRHARESDEELDRDVPGIRIYYACEDAKVFAALPVPQDAASKLLATGVLLNRGTPGDVYADSLYYVKSEQETDFRDHMAQHGYKAVPAQLAPTSIWSWIDRMARLLTARPASLITGRPPMPPLPKPPQPTQGRAATPNR